MISPDISIAITILINNEELKFEFIHAQIDENVMCSKIQIKHSKCFLF